MTRPCLSICEHRGWLVETELRTLMREARRFGAQFYNQSYDVFAKFIALTITNPLDSLSLPDPMSLNPRLPKKDLLDLEAGFVKAMAPFSQIILRFSCNQDTCQDFTPSFVHRGMTRYNNCYWDLVVAKLTVNTVEDLLFDPVNPDWQGGRIKLEDQIRPFRVFCETCGHGVGYPFVIIPKLTWMIRVFISTSAVNPIVPTQKPNYDPLEFKKLPYVLDLGVSKATAVNSGQDQERILWRKGMTSISRSSAYPGGIGHSVAVIYSGQQDYFYDGLVLSGVRDKQGKLIDQRMPLLKPEHLEKHPAAKRTYVHETVYTRFPPQYTLPALDHYGGLVKHVSVTPAQVEKGEDMMDTVLPEPKSRRGSFSAASGPITPKSKARRSSAELIRQTADLVLARTEDRLCQEAAKSSSIKAKLPSVGHAPRTVSKPAYPEPEAEG